MMQHDGKHHHPHSLSSTQAQILLEVADLHCLLLESTCSLTNHGASRCWRAPELEFISIALPAFVQFMAEPLASLVGDESTRQCV